MAVSHASTRLWSLARLTQIVAWTLHAIDGGSESLASVPACGDLPGFRSASIRVAGFWSPLSL
jgi:hypothetical protein